MTYKLAMKTADKSKSYQAVKEEHKIMVVMYVSKAVSREEVPNEAKVMSTSFRARVNVRGFMQIDVEHFNSMTYLQL